MENLFNGIYANKKVLITGHTGFKGSWLALWLTKLGAQVIGLSKDVPTQPAHFDMLGLSMESVMGNINETGLLEKLIDQHQPDIIFHLAAQPIVRLSYQNPIETFETNVLGTVKLLDACRKSNSLKALVNITTDKCYENREWVWGYRENDTLGGYDPYSASKACSEIVTSAYRNSFFSEKKGNKSMLIASARAGNVIGGGDWAPYRLIPDIIRATANKENVIIRNPDSTRPWQHVLEPLSGYLLLGQKLLENQNQFAQAWNFGPACYKDSLTVQQVVATMKNYWDKVEFTIQIDHNQPHEASLLTLDCSKALTKLKWQPIWSLDTTFQKTMIWYKNYYENHIVNSESDLSDYIIDAKNKNASWTKTIS